jgi:hypothetical protein
MIALYTSRAERHRASRDRELRRSALISRLRLATFLPAAAVLVWALARHASEATVGTAAALFVGFGALVVWHARVDERAEWFDALHTVCRRAAARIERRWDDLPAGEPPDHIDLSHHPYAVDLDLFGRASVFQWLGPAATAGGRARLAAWLLAAAETAEIAARQGAVTGLAPSMEWREAFDAHGVRTGAATGAQVDRLLAWAEGDPAFGRRTAAVHVSAFALTGAIWLLGVLWAAGAAGPGVVLVPILAGVIVSFALAGGIQSCFDRAGVGQRALSRYAALFEHAALAQFASPRLVELRARLADGAASAHTGMQRLNRILGFAELRTGAALLHFPIQALTLWDFHVLFALERWRRDAGRHVRDWMDALSELDALVALARAKHDSPQWCMPVIVDLPPEGGSYAGRRYTATDLGHPLIAEGRRVVNDVELGPPGTLLLVTGSNMSGKSTLLRAIGLNAVLAEAGSPVCATTLRMPPVNLQTSIRIQDSLELGLSYFMAALARLKGVVDAAERHQGDRVLFYLLDEILQGTNSAERAIAVRAVARHLLEAGAIGAMTTHDLTLAGQEPMKTAARLVHFTETVDARGTMTFDYKLRPGLATSRNALRLMEMIGIELPPEPFGEG